MSRTLYVVLVTVAVVGCAIQARAQTTASRVEASAGAALQRLWDDESSIGTGIAGSGAVSFALTDRLRLRGRVVGFNNERDFGNGVIFTATGLRYTVDLLWQPSSSRYSPYFGAGAGSLPYTRTSQYPIDPFQPGRSRFERSGTDTLFGGIAGFTAFSTDRFRLQPEASLWWSRPGYFIVIEVGVLASYRF